MGRANHGRGGLFGVSGEMRCGSLSGVGHTGRTMDALRVIPADRVSL